MSDEVVELKPDSYYKWQIAWAYDISMPHLRKLLDRFLKDLEDLGYNKRMQRVTPAMSKLIFEKLGPAYRIPPRRKSN